MCIRDRYRTGYDEAYEGHFQFARGDEKLVPAGEPAYKVVPGYPINKPWFEYQEEEGVYHRFQYGDRHYGDEGQIAVKNIIFQYVESVSYTHLRSGLCAAPSVKTRRPSRKKAGHRRKIPGQSF